MVEVTRMNDLAEHVGTIIALLGGVVVITGVLVGIIWKDLRRAIDAIKTEADEFSAWLKEQAEQGGVVTRSKFFEWAKQERIECPAMQFFSFMAQNKGGVVSKFDMDEALKGKVNEKVYEARQEQISENIKAIRVTIDKNAMITLNLEKNQLLILRALKIEPVKDDWPSMP